MKTPFLYVSMAARPKLMAIGNVREILPMMELHEAPPDRDTGGFCGFVNLRGTLVPVYSEAGARPLTVDSFIIVLEETGRLWGQVVDDVQDIVHLSAEQLCEAVVEGGRPARAARIDEEVIGIFNPSPGNAAP